MMIKARIEATSRGLQGAELAEYNRLAGKRGEKLTSWATLQEDGSMRMNAVTPSDARALEKSGAPRFGTYRGSR